MGAHLESGVPFDFAVLHLQLGQRGHQGLWHVLPSKLAEPSVLIRTQAWLLRCHYGLHPEAAPSRSTYSPSCPSAESCQSLSLPCRAAGYGPRRGYGFGGVTTPREHTADLTSRLACQVHSLSNGEAADKYVKVFGMVSCACRIWPPLAVHADVPVQVHVRTHFFGRALCPHSLIQANSSLDSESFWNFESLEIQYGNPLDVRAKHVSVF